MSEPLHRALGMTDEEYASVVAVLERDPTDAELAMYSVMWSEHCSYKSSRLHLRDLPTEAPWVVVGPGENAGVVDIGDGWLAAIRIESHNHPSFVEPYQGAATGVGGILRDVFTMGARPVALWNQIRFGELDEPRNRYLFGGVVAGIAGYGNAVGVPTVGGEVEFDDSYAPNPLVNVMCLGLLRREELVLGTAGEQGTIAVLLGNSTGRDGIGGASVLASASFEVAQDDKRPSVQVGDPFEEKKLIEACLELYDRRLVVGVQDLGAAGLSCASCEPAARAGTGMELYLDQVHTREHGMTAPELLMSESQERMMAFVRPDAVDEVLRVADKWEIDARVVGKVTAGDRLAVFAAGREVANVPAASLTDGAPVLDRPRARPGWLDTLWETDDAYPSEPISGTLLGLLRHPSQADPAWIYQQYDHMLFLNTMVGPGADASLIRVRGTDKGLAVTTDGNGRLCYLDPRRGAERLVWEAALNVAMVGARPLAVVDNLNFGNPEKPEVMWQFKETVTGMAQACEALGIPVVGGNVSFYNETDGVDIFPTPVVGLLGLADPATVPNPADLVALPGMAIWVCGPAATDVLAGSAAQKRWGRLDGRPVAADPAAGHASLELALSLTGEGVVLHDISRGGMLTALAEVLVRAGLGAKVELRSRIEAFNEDPHRFLCLATAAQEARVRELAAAAGCQVRPIGEVGGDRLEIVGYDSVAVSEVQSAWADALPKAMDQ